MAEYKNFGFVRTFFKNVSSSQSFVTLHLPLPVTKILSQGSFECSIIVTSAPACVSLPAQKSPAAPPPMIITFI